MLFILIPVYMLISIITYSIFVELDYKLNKRVYISYREEIENIVYSALWPATLPILILLIFVIRKKAIEENNPKG